MGKSCINPKKRNWIEKSRSSYRNCGERAKERIRSKIVRPYNYESRFLRQERILNEKKKEDILIKSMLYI